MRTGEAQLPAPAGRENLNTVIAAIVNSLDMEGLNQHLPARTIQKSETG